MTDVNEDITKVKISSIWPDPLIEDFSDEMWPNLDSNDASVEVWVKENKRILTRVVTWNQNAKSPPSIEEIRKVVLPLNKFHIFVIGTEECERSIAQSAINPSKKVWESYLTEAIGSNYTPIRSHTLQATHIIAFVHKGISHLCSVVTSAAVPTGAGNAMGNKGGVAILLKVGNTKMIICNAHLSAHQSEEGRRNADFHKINRVMPVLLEKKEELYINRGNSNNNGFSGKVFNRSVSPVPSRKDKIPPVTIVEKEQEKDNSEDILSSEKKEDKKELKEDDTVANVGEMDSDVGDIDSKSEIDNKRQVELNTPKLRPILSSGLLTENAEISSSGKNKNLLNTPGKTVLPPIISKNPSVKTKNINTSVSSNTTTEIDSDKSLNNLNNVNKVEENKNILTPNLTIERVESKDDDDDDENEMIDSNEQKLSDGENSKKKSFYSKPMTSFDNFTTEENKNHLKTMDQIAHLVIFMGDLNYRIKGNRAIVTRLIQNNMHEVLLKNDQLKSNMDKELVFPNYIEPPLNFLPTYKYDVGSNEYDSGAKKRIPSWTDRILYTYNNIKKTKYNQNNTENNELSSPTRRLSLREQELLHQPVVCLAYNCDNNISTSDHKPVYASFMIEVNFFVELDENNNLIANEKERPTNTQEINEIPKFTSESQVCSIM